RSSPVNSRAAYGLAVPHRQRREILRHAPVARLRARIKPGELSKRLAGHLRECFGGLPLARFEQHDFHPSTRQFIPHPAATRSGADDHDGVVFEADRWHERLRGRLARDYSLPVCPAQLTWLHLESSQWLESCQAQAPNPQEALRTANANR